MIVIYVQKTQARAELDAPVTSGSIGREVQFQFSADWDGLTKTAVFETLIYRESRPVPESGTVEIPESVLAYPGYQLRIGVVGKSADGATVIPTVYADCDAIKTGASTVPVGSPVKPSQAEALQREIDVLDSRLTTLIDPNDPESVAAVDFTPTNLGNVATGKITSNGTHAIVTLTSSLAVNVPAGEELEIATIPEGFEPVTDGFVPYNAGKFASLKVKVSGGKVYLVNDTESSQMTGKVPSTATFAYALKNPVFAEQADIRVGYDGTRYKTAGDAVRAQIKAAMEKTGGGSVELDTTLSISGKAADAKAVGDALAKIGADGLPSAEKSLILSLFKNAAYTADMSATIAQLETLWSGGDTPDIPDEPVVPDLPDADVSQAGSILSIVSGVTVSQSGSILSIA